jgi:hypothetical protein
VLRHEQILVRLLACVNSQSVKTQRVLIGDEKKPALGEPS